MQPATTEGRRAETLPKCERIRKRTEYLRVQGRGRKLHSASFLLFVVERKDREPARLGVTVSKKVGGAVERNHVKRLVREVFRRHKPWFPTGMDFVFVARREAAALDGPSTEQEIGRLCARYFAS